jgi:hypothetical protein
MKKETLEISAVEMANLLSDDNAYVEANSNNTDDISLYHLVERRTDKPFTLSNLNYSMINTLRGDIEFQRDSDDHKPGEFEEFVLDYITGHYMGDITLWKHPTDNKKWIINGKHRLTALQDFINGDLVLRKRYAKRFWSHFLPELNSLMNNGDVKVNQIAKQLSKGTIPLVRYNDLPITIQQKITAEVAITSTEVEIICKNVDGSLRIDGDIEIMKEISVFKELFNIKVIEKKIAGTKKNSLDEYKKLNEMIMSIMYFLDGKHTWNGSTKTLSKKVNQGEYRFIKDNAESKQFIKFMIKSIQPNYNRLFLGGDSINLPDGMKNITKGNLTNIRFFTYFLYVIHKLGNTPLYSGDVPNPLHRAIIEMASLIITTSKFTDTLEIDNTHPIYQNGLGKIYEQNQSVFIKLNEYRMKQRKKEDMEKMMIELFDICLQYVS